MFIKVNITHRVTSVGFTYISVWETRKSLPRGADMAGAAPASYPPPSRLALCTQTSLQLCPALPLDANGWSHAGESVGGVAEFAPKQEHHLSTKA